MSDPGKVGESSTNSSNPPELLSCVCCRRRKLKCDRVKPVCTRCTKVKVECVYPESRRKPAFKRRNVRELDARLVQVEGMLKDVSNPPAFATAPGARGKGPEDDVSRSEPASAHNSAYIWTGGGFDYDPAFNGSLLNGGAPLIDPPSPQQHSLNSSSPEESAGPSAGFTSGELYGLGQFEPLPPYEMIEELHSIYFKKQMQLIPIVHQGRYIQSFYSVPHMRPPMGLQYAIWMMAAHGDEKYGSYHDAFYQRARRYLEHDELRGYGEHFLTVRHAQAWALIYIDETRCMLFTRASMSSARCTKLVMMMGLHRLDDDSEAGQRLMAPTVRPPQDWTEAEERRRALWDAFYIDSHASIHTGWPNTFDVTEITTRLPASEEAFNSGREEMASTLHDVFKGSNYSVFAGAVIICHLFNQILRHVHRPQPNERPEDVDYGKFWTRHRELDNTISSAFMFLPERYKLPENLRNPVAVHTNHNLHAAVICLLHAACDKAERYNLPLHVKKVNLDRLLTAAEEIVSIVRQTANIDAGYRRPLFAMAIYCAATVYIYQAKETAEAFDSGNLELLIDCLAAIGREHIITRNFLQQIIRDVKFNPWNVNIDISKWENLPINTGNYNIPLLARSHISQHNPIQPPLPGQSPLQSKSFGVGPGNESQFGCVIGEVDEDDDDDASGSRPVPKRKRTTAGSAVTEAAEFVAATQAAAMAPVAATVVNAASLSPAASRNTGNATRQAAPGGLWPPESPAVANQHVPAGSSATMATGFSNRHFPHRQGGSSPVISTASPTTAGGMSGMGHPYPIQDVYCAPVGAEQVHGGPSQQHLPPPPSDGFYADVVEGQQWNVMGPGSQGYVQFYPQDLATGGVVGYGASVGDNNMWIGPGDGQGQADEGWNVGGV